MVWGLWPKESDPEAEAREISLQDCGQSLKRLEQSVCDLDRAAQKLRLAILKKKNGNND